MTTASILAKITLTFALALVGVRVARRSRASVRHLLLAAAFAVSLLLPIASAMLPAVQLELPIAARSAAVLASLDPMAMDDAVADDARAAASSSRGTAIAANAPISAATLLLALWLAGAACCLLPAVAGLWHVRAIRRSGLPWRDGQSMVDTLARDAGVGRRVDLLVHESVSGPITCGVVRPAIVLPMAASTWGAADFTRAVVHELEHVRRGDWLSQCLARLVCAAYWFHPLVWIAERQLALEAERACDDAVLRRSEVTEYADQLVTLAQRLSGAHHRAALGMANRADLATRVGAVLDRHQSRGRARLSWVVLACATSAVLMIAMSPLRIVASAQTAAAQMQAAGVQRYDAATIKPCAPENQIPGPARGGAGGTNATFSAGRFNVPCVTAEQLIYLAYAAQGARPDEYLVNDGLGGASDDAKVRGGPSWVHSYKDKFAIEATAPASVTERTVLMGAMLRTLLEERFKLKLHRDQEEVDMLALTAGNSGFKLKPMKRGDCDDDRSQPFDANAAVPRCGNMNSNIDGPNTVWTFVGFGMDGLAGRLSRTLGLHVIDRTGLKDEYIIRLQFHPDDQTPGIVWPGQRDADPSIRPAASILTALDEQLGLKISKVKAPRGFLVIDHIEKPSPNEAISGARR